MIEFRYNNGEERGNPWGRQPDTKVTVTTDAVTLDELVPVFERFLLACGFGLPPGAHIGYEYDDVEYTTDDVNCGGFGQARESPSESTDAKPGGAEAYVTPDAVVEAIRFVEREMCDEDWESVLTAAVRELATWFDVGPHLKAVFNDLDREHFNNLKDIACAVEGMDD